MATWQDDPDAVAVHAKIEERLEFGQERFGPWQPGAKETIADSLEEALDLAIYIARKLVRIEAAYNRLVSEIKREDGG
jgi:hypothetical protein